MRNWLKQPLASLAGIGSATVGGFYVAFSAVVMPSLRKRQADNAASTMIVINEHAVRAPFMALFFGTAAACAAVAIISAVNPIPGSAARLGGAAAYLAGVALTVVVNVPLNNRLASGSGWASFVGPWTRANHARAALSALGAAALLL